MKSRILVWATRIALFIFAFVAPGVGYAIRSAQTGNAKTALDGFVGGLFTAAAVAVVFALTFQVSGVGRFSRGATFLVAIILMWAAVPTVLSWFHA